MAHPAGSGHRAVNKAAVFSRKNPGLKQESHLSGSFSAFRATGNNSLT